MRDKVIFLVIGAVVSVLFWIFRVELYEAVYNVPGFSDQMYNTGAYGSVAAVTFVIASYSMRWWSSNCRHTPIPQ